MAVGRFNIPECQIADFRSSLIHRKCLLGLDIVCVTIRITIIEAVDHKRSHHMVHADIFKNDLIQHSVFAAASAGLDTKSPVCMKK